jgi:hypothetical protein
MMVRISADPVRVNDVEGEAHVYREDPPRLALGPPAAQHADTRGLWSRGGPIAQSTSGCVVPISGRREGIRTACFGR